MPELPEVETLVRDLRATVVGRMVTEARVAPDAQRLVQGMPVEVFTEGLRGRQIKRVERRGKFVLIGLSPQKVAKGPSASTPLPPSLSPPRSPQDDKAYERSGPSGSPPRRALPHSPRDDGTVDTWWVAHRRMSGNFLLRPQDALDEPFIRARFRLDDGNELRFVDLRKFGTMTLVDDPEPLLTDLGPEPLDAAFTDEVLAATLKKRNIAVKSVLLDQGAIAGIGNLYADEALHYARIHPLRIASKLKKDEVAALREGIVRALEQGLRNCGSSVGHVVDGEEVSLRDHVNLNGQSGKNQEYLVAYGREGRPCRDCGTAIERLKIGNRSAHYCPTCQKRGRARATGVKRTAVKRKR
ncbi:MAG TPA: bifunctional DNA-formamidopyrimidine glycosylase/DNA-(apurinic or apyrimidinic site) lyase [Dehalococcoidia bacterium]